MAHQVTCLDCNSIYIEGTSQNLMKRLQQHKTNSKNLRQCETILTEPINNFYIKFEENLYKIQICEDAY